MAHKNLIGDTAYDTKGGRCLVDGTGYDVKNGRTLVDGTGYDVSLAKGCTISITGGSNNNSTYASVTINGTEYGSNLQMGVYQDVKVDSGTEITLQVMSVSPYMVGNIVIDDVSVAHTTAANTPVVYRYAVVSDISVSVQGKAMGPTIIITSN